MENGVKAMFSVAFGLIFLAFSPVDTTAGQVVAVGGAVIGAGTAAYFWMLPGRWKL